MLPQNILRKWKKWGLQFGDLQQYSKHVMHMISLNLGNDFRKMTKGQKREWQTYQWGVAPIR